MSQYEHKSSKFKSGFFFGSLFGGFIGYLFGQRQANADEDSEFAALAAEATDNVREFVVNMRDIFVRAFEAGQAAAREKRQDGRTQPEDYDLDNPDL